MHRFVVRDRPTNENGTVRLDPCVNQGSTSKSQSRKRGNQGMNRVFVSMVAYSLLASASLATLARAQELNPQPLPPGPDPRVQITEAYARLARAMPSCGRGRW